METWRQIQKTNFTKREELARFLGIDPEIIFASPFPLNVPYRLAEKMEKGQLNDPLLMQFLPTHQEALKTPGFTADPVSDCSFQKSSRLLQKYQGRALLITTSACVMNCRFCFRQNYPYSSDKDLSQEIELIRNDPSLHEVILSGGDPLSLSDQRLQTLITALGDIPHLKLLRFHTRFPLGIPERITPAFLKILAGSRLQTIFVLHTNHPKELDPEVLAALKKIPAPLLTQTVLLKGINDSVDTLKSLFLTLASHGILPYYLHQFDRIEQGAHFEVPIAKGKQLLEMLKKELPGYAIPTYVQEIPHESSKTRL
ncbi:MAG: KamA family radical SAM protein [Chlamydiia bacterium]|nr:KamA family radical SAM protein [Chlamydiia bacterium]